MPVFFYIDPEYLEDPFLEGNDTVYLSYTFFESKPGLELPVYQQSSGFLSYAKTIYPLTSTALIGTGIIN